jgi:hypothetical protein
MIPVATSPWPEISIFNAYLFGFEEGLRTTLHLETRAYQIRKQIRRARWYGEPMGPEAIDKGVREGWLVVEEDGWHRFVWDFVRDPLTKRWVKIPARGIRRVRIVELAHG